MLSMLLMVAASAVVWCVVYRSTVRHPLDPVALTLYYLALQLVWRPFTLAVGLDTPFPTGLFVDRDVVGLVLGAQAVVILWLLALWAGARLLAPAARPLTLLFPRSRAVLGSRELLLLAVGLSALSFATTALLWARYGGPTGLIEASKVARDVAESRALRTIPLLAALFAVAAFFAAKPGARTQRVTALGLVALNGYLSFTWGARDVPVLSVVALVAGSLIFGRAHATRAGSDVMAWLRDPRWQRRMVLVAVLVIGSAFALRAARDTAVLGGPAPTIAGESTVRQVAVATNNTYYDTLLLVLDDWPDEQDLHDGRDFVDAAVASVPSVLAGEQDRFVSPAVQVAQTYIDRNNGFPATAVGDWYLNLGLLGVLLGGVLSGLVARAAQLALHRFTRDPLVWGLSLVFMLTIFPGGVWVTSLPKWVGIGVPLLAVTVVLNWLFGRRRRTTTPYADAAAAPRRRTERVLSVP